MTIKATTANTHTHHTHTHILMWVLIVARGKLISTNEKGKRKKFFGKVYAGPGSISQGIIVKQLTTNGKTVSKT